jgi:hypothetical protein
MIADAVSMETAEEILQLSRAKVDKIISEAKNGGCEDADAFEKA